MPTPAGRALLTRPRALVATVAAVLIFAACGATASPPPATPSPSPSVFAGPSPWPHLTEPATADDVFRALIADGLAIVPNTASSGGPGKEPVKRIDGTYAGWPIAIIQYKTTKSMRKATNWKSGAKPVQGEAPIAMTGLNILVEWGSKTGAAPAQPVGPQVDAAHVLRFSLESLLSPLRTRLIVPVPGPTPSPTPVPAVSGEPAATPSAAS